MSLDESRPGQAPVGRITGGWMKGLLVINSVLIAGIYAMGAQKPGEPAPKDQGQGEPPRIVEAETFLLRDEQGNVRAALDMEKGGGPVLKLFDADGKLGASIGFHDNGSVGVRVCDTEGIRGMLSYDESGVGTFLYDPKGNLRASTGVNEDGLPSVSLVDAGGETRAILGMSSEGWPSLFLSDPHNVARVELSVRGDEQGGLGVYDQKGTRRAGLGMNGAEIGVAVFDEKGDPTAEFPD